MKFKASYSSRGVKVSTRAYSTKRQAIDALERGMRRRGIEPGVLHLPGVVSGDTGDCVPRANGLMCVVRKE